jgi:hypothetical protein
LSGEVNKACLKLAASKRLNEFQLRGEQLDVCVNDARLVLQNYCQPSAFHERGLRPRPDAEKLVPL